MPVPKRKLSRSRRDMRSANKHITPQPFALCQHEGCKAPLLPHRVCTGCGFYKGVKVLEVKKAAVAPEPPAA